MADFGHLILLFLFPLSLFAVATAVLAGKTHRYALLRTAQRATYAAFLVTTLAVLALEYLLVTSDFSIEFVASNTNLALPFFYKIVALWAGHDGSLLLWTWVLTACAALVVYQNRNRNEEVMPWVIAVLMATAVFFSILNVFIANPFQTLYQSMGGTLEEFSVADGRGLNPLLQHPAMIIHPPVLFIGYVGTVIPFAFAIAALITGKLGAGWIRQVRRWALVGWAFLSAGIVLGGKWAYVELGWGGYWAWDPVENASLLPWLTGTAYLHSVMIQERKGMLKIWNMSLVIASYLLAIFGTFLTRSGVVSSVHAFSNSGLGPAFTGFLFIALVFSAALMIWRRKDLQSDEDLDSVVSRESGFLFNNLMFLLATLAVLWGTMFPVLSEAFTGEKITVGPPWFNTIMVPLGLAILLLTGVGPLLAWRQTSLDSLRRSFAGPLLGAIVLAALLMLFGIRDGWALGSFAIGIFVVWTIVLEFIRGALIRVRNAGEPFFRALLMLSLKNTRRYGGYLIHFGMVVIFAGITGNAFNSEIRAEVGEGDSFELGPYQFTVESVKHSRNENYTSDYIDLRVEKGGKLLEIAKPERRFYIASEQPSTEVDIHSNFREDLYIVLSGANADGSKAIVQVYRNPLVMWVWLGAAIMIFGTIWAMIPAYRRKAQPAAHIASAVEEESIAS